MLSMLVAWDDDGRVIATLAYRVLYDESKPDRPPLGLVDFEAHELAGKPLTDIWRVASGPKGAEVPAAGSGTWPEWLGQQAHGFKVELESDWQPGRHRVKALIHRGSGHRRERAALMDEIGRRHAEAPRDAHGRPVVDLSDLVGGPGRPLLLDGWGRTAARPAPGQTRLPLVAINAGVVHSDR